MIAAAGPGCGDWCRQQRAGLFPGQEAHGGVIVALAGDGQHAGTELGEQQPHRVAVAGDRARAGVQLVYQPVGGQDRQPGEGVLQLPRRQRRPGPGDEEPVTSRRRAEPVLALGVAPEPPLSLAGRYRMVEERLL